MVVEQRIVDEKLSKKADTVADNSLDSNKKVFGKCRNILVLGRFFISQRWAPEALEIYSCRALRPFRTTVLQHICFGKFEGGRAIVALTIMSFLK
jgi:hypothetical protein